MLGQAGIQMSLGGSGLEVRRRGWTTRPGVPKAAAGRGWIPACAGRTPGGRKRETITSDCVTSVNNR